MLLSSDGRYVAVGAYDEAQDELVILDLSDGAVREVPVPAAEDIRPLAWSLDGKRLAYTVAEVLFVLDLRSGTASRLPEGTGAVGAAFSPVTDELAVLTATLTVTATGIGTFASPRLLVLAADGALQRTLRHRGFERPLGSNAWSPDGRSSPLMPSATGSPSCAPMAAATRPRAHGAAPGGRLPRLLRRLVVERAARARDRSGHRRRGGDAALIETGLTGQDERVLTTISTNNGNEAVWRMQLASALLPGHFSRSQTGSDTGQWPLRFTPG
jgi:hypothetical protein